MDSDSEQNRDAAASTSPTATRRRVLRAGAATGALGLGVTSLGTASAAPGKPDFFPRIYGDGKPWGTKVTGVIKNPNHNSLDKFFVVMGGPDGQLPVSEAAPGNPDYNGGRWWTHQVHWTDDRDPANRPLLTRYGPADDSSSIQYHLDAGHLTVTEGSFDGGPPTYFRCPLLPVKD